MYNNILLAHHKVNQTLIFHGSSGFGKTTNVKLYAEWVGARLIDKRTSTMDPLTLFLPWLSSDKSTIETALATWVHDMINATSHTIIFLDEITNPSSPEVYSVLKELLGERTILGRKISPHVQFIGASNLTSEDTGVKEMPNSLWTRATHILFAPTSRQIIGNLLPEARMFFANKPDLLAKPAVEDFPLKPQPRQIDDCIRIFRTGILEPSELRQVCAGKIGKDVGYIFADELIESMTERKSPFPDTLNTTSMTIVKELEDRGMSLEILHYLQRDNHDKAMVAQYLAEFAGPELSRNAHEAKLQLPLVPNACVGREAGMPWQLYCSARNSIRFGDAQAS